MEHPKSVENLLASADLTGVDAEELRQWVKESIKDASYLARKIRKQEFEFTTILEASNLIHAKAVENFNVADQLTHQIKFLINTAKGYFGVSNVALLNQDSKKGNMTRFLLSKSEKELTFDISTGFAKHLAKGMPLQVEDPAALYKNCQTEIDHLKEGKFAICVPLLADSTPTEGRAVGLLCFGHRFTKEPFNPPEVRFMGLLGNMLGIALHNARLHEKSIIDSLTQVFSRGYFDTYLEKEIKRAGKIKSPCHDDKIPPVSLIMLDIDHFKAFNDTYGHQTGDEVLTIVSQIIKDSVRHNDVVARYGGEEFAVIAPGAEIKVALELAERIRISIEAHPINAGGKPVVINASLGVSQYPGNATSPATLIKAADDALYKAKENGRNQVCEAV